MDQRRCNQPEPIIHVQFKKIFWPLRSMCIGGGGSQFTSDVQGGATHKRGRMRFDVCDALTLSSIGEFCGTVGTQRPSIEMICIKFGMTSPRY